MKMKTVKGLAVAMVTGITVSMPVMAAPVTLPDGTVFDPDFYAEANSDVAENFGTSAEALYIHYDLFGKEEGRLAYADMNGFDASYYAAKNSDVVNALGDHPAALYQHYILAGRDEGRDVKIDREEATDPMAFLQEVYTLMAAGEYLDIAVNYDGSDMARAIADEIPSGGHINFTADGIVSDYNGVAAGIYRTGENGYYFFYGNLVNGVRNGEGTAAWKASSRGCEIFEGIWENDAPNGNGQDTQYYTNGDIYITRGNYTNGLENGEMTALYYSDGVEYRMYNSQNGPTYTASMGTAPEITRDVWAGSYFDETLTEKIIEARNAGYILYWYGMNPETEYVVWSVYSAEYAGLGVMGYKYKN